MRFFYLFTALLILALPAAAQSSNMTLLGEFPGRGFTNDIWAYVAPDGTEYAVMGTGGGVSIIELPLGAPPQEVAFVPGSIATGFDVKVYQHYAYSVDGGGEDLEIIDISDPANPVRVLETTAIGAHNIAIADGYLYTMGGPGGIGGLRIYSLDDPVNPDFVGSYEPYYYHDIMVRGDTVYAAAIFGEGIDILDVSDKASPALIANFNYPGSGAHNVCSTDSGSYVFVGDEIGTGTWTYVFDARDPQNVTLVDELITNPNEAAHNCYVRDDILYVAHYGEGVRVYDVRDPLNIEEIAFYVTPAAWTPYPYLPSGRLIVSDINDGLLVFDVATPVASEPGAEQPVAFALEAAYPNPFNPSTTLRFSLEEASEIRLAILDAMGREVALVAEGRYASGRHDVRFEAGDLPSGVYLARLSSGGRADTQRITLLK